MEFLSTCLGLLKSLGIFLGLIQQAKEESTGAVMQREADDRTGLVQASQAKASDDAIDNMSLDQLAERERLRQSGHIPPPPAAS